MNRKTRGTQLMVMAAGILLLGLILVLPWPAMAGEEAEAEIKIEQAKELFSEQKYLEALDMLNQVVAAEPENGEAYHYMGLCQMALGKPADALPLFEKAASLQPAAAGLQEDIAWAALRLGDFAKANAAADQALSLNAASLRAAILKGQALMGEKKYEEALPWLKKAEGDPVFGQAALYHQGTCLMYLGRLEEARGYFERCRAAGPETELGKSAGDYAEALREGAEPGGPAQKPKPFGGRVRLLYQYDTNILPVADEDFLPEDVTDMEDSRMVVDLDLHYRYVAGKTSLVARYLGYASFHSQESSVNLMFHLAEIQGFYQGNLGKVAFRTGTTAAYSYAALDGDPYSTYWTVVPEISLSWTKALRTRLALEYLGETFDDPGEDLNNRDNTRYHVSLYQHFLFADGKVNTWLGYRYGQITADGDNYNRVDNDGLAGLIISLPKKALFSLVYRYEDRDYLDNSFDRKEHLNLVNAAFQMPVYKKLGLYVGVAYLTVDANLSMLEYDRWIYSLGLAWDF